MTRVGPWLVATIRSGNFALDGGAMFGIVPRTLWSRAFPPDPEGRIRLAARSLVLKHDDGRVVLVDAGMGSRWRGRSAATYSLDDPDAERGGGLVAGLSRLDLRPSSVTDVIATHLHFDHVGGLVTEGLKPFFPRAKVHVQVEHLAWAKAPSRKDRASFRAADFRPLEEAGLLVAHEGPGELIPDLSVRLSYGHTPAMQLPLIRAAEGSAPPVFFPSDLVPTTAHVQLPWVMAYDNQPVVTVDEKASLFEEAAEEEWTLVSDHDPEVAAFRLRRGRTGFEVDPVDLGGPHDGPAASPGSRAAPP